MNENRRPRILVLGHVNAPIIKAGGKPVCVGATDERAIELVEQGDIDGLLLTGGGDVNPELYGQTRRQEVYGVNDDRDVVDTWTLDIAVERGIPVMGICRGHQIINVAMGGTLHQHIPALPTTRIEHGGGREHLVAAAPGSRLAEAFEGLPRAVVSIHHQAVDQLADGFVTTGWAGDGTIEAIESVEGWVLGVQFHPEMAHDWPSQQRIFDGFIAAAAKHAGLSVPTHRAALAPAGQAPRPAKPKPGHRFGPVITQWRCSHGIRFDTQADYYDHMEFIHGVNLDKAGQR